MQELILGFLLFEKNRVFSAYFVAAAVEYVNSYFTKRSLTENHRVIKAKYAQFFVIALFFQLPGRIRHI
ncbi:hypothetical protein [Silvibacterium acidisoli]|uniref:hypothetical protein n=1 Tax=Acidobacteriaceae bacterium ZG23-2 TaxID=2883246 RepID=UPI00406D35AA